MGRLALIPPAEFAEVQTVGIPRGLLYYRYGVLWETFFRALGRRVVLSRETDRGIVAEGEALSVDECCLASKAYLGHVASLIGSCDALFIPSISNVGRHCGFCTKFQALPDLVANTFCEQNVVVASCLVDAVHEHVDMRSGFIELAGRFALNSHEAKRAWKEALHAQMLVDKTCAHAQERLLHARAQTKGTGQPLAILMVAHPYIAHDHYLGGRVVNTLESLGATVLFADETERERTLKASFDFSETLPWIINRELIGSITLLHDRVDGIVLVSAFPCGPDSMTDDAIMRCIEGKPILNLTIDAQSGTAGLETRVESFIDILRYKRRGGYLHV